MCFATQHLSSTEEALMYSAPAPATIVETMRILVIEEGDKILFSNVEDFLQWGIEKARYVGGTYEDHITKEEMFCVCFPHDAVMIYNRKELEEALREWVQEPRELRIA